jgi:hypothetical protein
VSTIDNWRLWTIGFVTEVRIESEPQINYRVDAFPLFYELLNACGNIGAKREFEVLVGEEIVLEGAAADDRFFEVKVSHYRGQILLSKRLRSADALLFLVLKTGEMASSLERIDVDLEHFFSKFPIGIYRRGIG